MKFRFWQSYTNARGKFYGASISDGYGVHVRGWDAGVKVVPCVRGGFDNEAGTERLDADEFDVYLTWGSNGGDRSVQLGTVQDTTDGPMWIPEGGLPAIYTNPAAPARLRKHRIRRGSRASTPMQAAHSPDYMAAMAEDRPDILARIDSALAGPTLDAAVFGPEPYLARTNY